MQSGRDGPPRLPANPDLALSLARSERWCGFALRRGGGPVGLDIERVRPLDWQAMLAMVTTAQEQAALALLAGPDAAVAFFRLWTVKEAVLKAQGRGLAGDAKRVPVPEAMLLGTAATARVEALGRTWHVQAASRNGIQLALACQAGPMRTENGPIS